MPVPLIAAGVTAAAGIGGAVMSSNAQKKAANQASDTALQVANQNNALAREMYGKNEGHMLPFINRGNAAGEAYNAMLGLGGGMTNSAGMAQITPANDQGWQPAYGGRSPDMAITQDTVFDMQGNPIGPTPTGSMPSQVMSGGAAAGFWMQPVNSPQQGNAGDPFRQYIANSDYGFKFGEGSNALNHGLASSGSINSGAAMKAMEKYRQNLQAGYRGEYMDRLNGQQTLGFGGASALAGVGQNMVNNVSANNNSAGTAAANAALMRGNSQSQMWGGVANSLGQFAGSSYKYWG